MTTQSMRKGLRLGLLPPRANALISRSSTSSVNGLVTAKDVSRWRGLQQQTRRLASVRDDETWFDSSFVAQGQSYADPPKHPSLCLYTDGIEPQRDERPPDERTLRLGKTVSVLHDRLPTLLASPLPAEILSPQIKLNLFPSTHPHLPTVSGRLSYTAALWTAPVAWGRVPVVGNVRLEILSERMLHNGSSRPQNPPNPSSTQSASHTSEHDPTYRSEKLIVRWKTCGRTKNRAAFLRAGRSVRDDEEFCGLFIFEFDEEGRVVAHTIEHAEQGRNWERMTRVVSVTDWLIGLAKGRSEPDVGLALGFVDAEDRVGVGVRRPDRDD